MTTSIHLQNNTICGNVYMWMCVCACVCSLLVKKLKHLPFHFIFCSRCICIRKLPGTLLNSAEIVWGVGFWGFLPFFQGSGVCIATHQQHMMYYLTRAWLLDCFSNRFQVNPRMRGQKQTFKPADFFSLIVPRNWEFDTWDANLF